MNFVNNKIIQTGGEEYNTKYLFVLLEMGLAVLHVLS